MSRRGIVLVLTLIVLAMTVSLAGLLVLSLVASPPVTVPANATLYLKIRAPFSEVEPLDLFGGLVEQPQGLRETVGLIQRARDDQRIRALVILPSTTGALWAQIQEVRAAVADFRASGKPVTAYLEFGGAHDYYLASAADRILMMPAGQLDVSGLATYELFFRGALDKIGVYPDLLHIGDYKTASNTFTERGFTPAHREVTASMNQSWYDEIVRAVADGRQQSEDVVRAALDGGPYRAPEALEAGLVDALVYGDQIDDEEPLRGTNRIESERYLRARGSSRGGPRIALLYAVGTITSGKSALDGQNVGSDTFVDWVRRVRVDPSIRAIVVRIDSPGGSAIASEVIWRELSLARDVKPVVVSMGDVAASGGYYIAAPAHAIVAQPGTITGSIGVVTGKYVVQGTMDHLGIGTAAVGTGPTAQIYSPFRPFTPAERTRVEAQMRATYDLFVDRVVAGRQASRERIDAVAQGRVWTGRQALELGLVDELGGLDRAIELAQEHGKLDTSQGVTLVVYPPKRTIFDVLSNPLGVTIVSAIDYLAPRAPLGALRSASDTLARFRQGEPLALMPNVFWR